MDTPTNNQLRFIINGMPPHILKGKRTFTLEELTLRLAAMGTLSHSQIEAIVNSANLSCCQPPLTNLRVAGIVRRELKYFHSEKFANHIPRVEWK